MSKNESKDETLLKLLKGGKGKKASISDISHILKINKVNLNVLDNHGYSILHHAIRAENYEAVNLFLNLTEDYQTEKADPNLETADQANDVYLSTLLFALIFCDDFSASGRIIKSLIKAGAQLGYKDDDDCTFFLRTCEKGRSDIMEFIFSQDQVLISINDERSKHGGGLHMAIIGQQEELIPYLLDKKIDLMITDYRGNTALHLALEEKQMNSFKTILDYVTSSKELTNEFKKNLFNYQNNEGNTILHELAYCKSSMLISFLKKFPTEYAMNEEIKNNEGYTYIGVQENLIKLQKYKEERDKMIRDEMKKERERIRQEKIMEELKIQKEEEERRMIVEKQRALGRKMIKYRAWIFFGIFLVFLAALFIMVKNATKKKEIILY